MGGLEPPQISLHAPQTCASTIPPHRQVISIIIDYIADNTAGQLFFIWGTVSQTPKLNASAFLEHTYAFLVFAKPSLARLKLRQVRFLKRQSSTLASHVCSCKICTTCKFLRTPRVFPIPKAHKFAKGLWASPWYGIRTWHELNAPACVLHTPVPFHSRLSPSD